jgi:outer membrane protein assembly factor BamB
VPSESWSKVLPGPVTQPLTTDGQRIYAVAEGRVYCLDLDGNVLWNIGSSPTGGVAVTDQGPVVGTTTGRLVVLDPKDGSTVRSTTAGGEVRGLPVQLPTSVAWVTLHGLLSSTADWGREVALSAAGSVAADGDTLFVSTLEGGLVAATRDTTLWQATLPAPAVEGPALDATREYVPVSSSEGHPGGVVAFDRAGKEVWRHQTRFHPAAALAVGSHVLVPDKDGRLYALDPETGAEAWVFEAFGEFSAQPAIVEGQVYAGNGDGNLYRIDDFDGGQGWKVPLGAPVTGDPVVVHGLIVVGLANGRIVALGEGR